MIGGGAAGFFSAIAAAEAAARPPRILICEQGRNCLQKVRISGGGRCNVTHAEFDPASLASHYPRGRSELLGPFHHFGPGDTMGWFEDRGVPLKIENDGRVFPRSDSSASIVDALQRTAERLGIAVRQRAKVERVDQLGDGWSVVLATGDRLSAKTVVLATGSAPRFYRILARMGVEVIPPVPSLFSFNVPDPALHALKGLSVPNARLSVDGLPYETFGSTVITHWGLSGPLVLRMSAEAALELHARDYSVGFRVSWTGATPTEMRSYLSEGRLAAGRQTVRFDLGLGLPKRLWRYLVDRADVNSEKQWAAVTKAELGALADAVAADAHRLKGQTRFKEEFVTAGGIELKEVDFRTFSLKRLGGLYAVGELLNIDGVTGGFNFQAAWTGGYLAGSAIGKRF